jgi:hypothetical protein
VTVLENDPRPDGHTQQFPWREALRAVEEAAGV